MKKHIFVLTLLFSVGCATNPATPPKYSVGDEVYPQDSQTVGIIIDVMQNGSEWRYHIQFANKRIYYDEDVLKLWKKRDWNVIVPGEDVLPEVTNEEDMTP